MFSDLKSTIYILSFPYNIPSIVYVDGWYTNTVENHNQRNTGRLQIKFYLYKDLHGQRNESF